MNTIKILSFCIAIILSNPVNSYAQCTLYDLSSLWGSYENLLPCDATCGTPIAGPFEIWSNEAYPLGTLTAGSEYIFTISASVSWNPTITVAAWDGTNVGAVVDFADGRSLSLTIPTTGDYIVIITITGSCDGASTNGLDNGILSVDCGVGGATCISLPIELVYFRAKKAENSALLSWRTETETNNEYFAIERSSNGVDFQTIGRVQGSEMSTTPLNYSFVDAHPILGTNYYRLRQVDYDGTFNHSNVIALQFAFDLTSQFFYPNPFRDQFNVDIFSEGAGEINIQVVDVLGKVIYTKTYNVKEGLNSFKLGNHTQNWARGTYFMEITGFKTTSYHKIMKN